MLRPKGFSVEGWTPPVGSHELVLEGAYARLERLDPEKHVGDLFRANAEDQDAQIWDYLPYGPFSSQSSYYKWARDMAALSDPFFYAIKNKATGRFCGVASFLRIDPNAGSIEVGHINFAPTLQRTPAATEAMFLMMDWAFGAGYRRYEWKCDALNAGSRRAAQRLGLSYEGVFRQATMYKGRNRDTAWFAAIDKEWPALKEAYTQWLRPENFDENGQQFERLGELTGLVRVADDPTLI